MHALREQRTPDNCLALLAVTMEDLYQVLHKNVSFSSTHVTFGEDHWVRFSFQESPDLFIAGLAQGNRRVGVFSFYR